MPNKFIEGDKVRVHHQDARGIWAWHDGKYLAQVAAGVSRVELMGLRMLWPDNHIVAAGGEDAEQSSDAQVQSGKAP